MRLPRINQLQHQNPQVLLLDGRQSAVGEHGHRLPLELRRARHLEQRVQVGPLRRNPLLVAEQADLGIKPLVRDLAGDELGQERLPLVALRVIADLARERLIAE